MKNLQYFCTRFRERHSGATNEPGKRVKFYREQNFFAKILAVQNFALSLQSVSLNLDI